MCIAAYVAQQLKMWPQSGTKQEFLAWSILNACDDLKRDKYSVEFGGNAAKENHQKFVELRMIPWLQYWDRFLKTNGKEYMLGTEMYACDICVWDVFDQAMAVFPEMKKALDDFPDLKAYLDRVASDKNLAEYLKKRK